MSFCLAQKRWPSSLAVVVVVSSLACLMVASLAHAEERAWAPASQPAHLPRQVHGQVLVALYADTPVVGTQARFEHYLDEELRAFVRQDERFLLGDPAAEARLEELSRQPEMLEAERLAERYLELGSRLFRAGEVAGAIAELETGLRLASETTLRWRRPAAMADALAMLAICHFELAGEQPELSEVHEGAARQALRELIRLTPGAQPDDRLYPSRFIEEHRRAFYEQVYGTAAWLSLRGPEARQLVEWLGVDVLVDVRLMSSVRGAQQSIRIWDRLSERFVYDALLAWDGSLEHARVSLERALSAAAACMAPWAPPVDTSASRPHGKTWLAIGWTGQVPLIRPSSRPFLLQGLTLGGQHLIGENVGVNGGLRLLFSNRDAEGELLDVVNIVSMYIGATFQYRHQRLRLWLDTALEIAHRGEVLASDAYWCRVSGGRIRVFDAQRSCRLDDLRSEGPAVLGSIYVRAGLAIQLAGPVWAYVGGSSSLYMLPLARQALDRLLGVDTGLMYRF